jgi:hypothetical protein
MKLSAWCHDKWGPFSPRQGASWEGEGLQIRREENTLDKQYNRNIPRFFSYEAWPSLGHSTANHNSRDVVSEQFSVVTFYRLAIASLAWSTSLGCKICTWELLWARLCSEWPDRNWPRSTRIQSAHPTLPTLLHSVLLISFHQSFMRKETEYNTGYSQRVLNTGHVYGG